MSDEDFPIEAGTPPRQLAEHPEVTPAEEAAWRADHPLPPIGEAAGEVPMEPETAAKPETTVAKTDVRDFTAFFRELRRGAAEYEAGIALQELVAAVEATGKPGTLSIKLTITPDPQYGTAVGVADDATVKLPKPTKPSSLFYMDGSHNLRREDPGQLRIPTHDDTED